MTIGYVFKAEYFLPENASNYINTLADPFDITPRPITGERKRRRSVDQVAHGYDSVTNQKYERYRVKPELIGSESNEPGTHTPSYVSRKNYFSASQGKQNSYTSRWILYKGIEILAQR